MLDDDPECHPLLWLVAECQSTIRQLREDMEGATEEDMTVTARDHWDHVTGLPHEEWLLPQLREDLECPVCLVD